MGRHHSQAQQVTLDFSKAELERYSRQILLHGIAAQRRLKAARVLVIGAGGLGATLLPSLAAAGIGSITIVDGDRVEQSNLGRQNIFRERDIGRQKALVAKEFLHDLNPHISVTAVERAFNAGDTDLVAAADIVCEGSDSLANKFLVNDLALRANRPAFIAALGKDQGHAMFIHHSDSACYRCVFDEIDASVLPTCAGEGILSTFPAVVSASVAHALVSHLLTPLDAGTLWVFEKNHCRNIQIKKRKGCDRHP